MERRRLIRALPRRTTAGVAAVVAAALGVTLLSPWGEPDTTTEGRTPAKAAGPLDESAAQKKARSSGKRVEVTALTDETSTTYALPNGSFELTAHAAPVRAKVDGAWKPIDTTLKRTKNGWTPKATTDPVVFHAGGDRSGDRADRAAGTGRAPLTVSRTASAGRIPAAGTAGSYTDLVTFTSDGHQITVGWPGALPEPEVNGPNALYREVLDGVDLVLTARASGFNHVLVVRDAKAAAALQAKKVSYRLTSPDLTFHLDPTTHVVSAKDDKGAEIGVSPTPYMWDSAAKPKPGTEEAAPVFGLPGLSGPEDGAHTAVGKAGLEGDGSGSATLTVTPDASLLSGKETVWPAFVDPSITGKTTNWTTIYAKYPSSSFYDGANYGSGTTEARVGYESTTGGLSRSFFRLGWTTSFKGATVSSASIRLLETYAWSCDAREMKIYRTGSISSSTTWNNPPDTGTKELIGAKSFAHGWSSACPDAYVTYDAKPVAQAAANGGWTNLTIGLYATNESSSYSWKKFKAEGESAPKITIVYNRKPNLPTKLSMSPGSGCDTTSPYPAVGKSDVTFTAVGSDPDGDLRSLHFEAFVAGTTTKIVDSVRTVDSTGRASVIVAASKFVNGQTYTWRVRGIDASGAGSAWAPGTAQCGFKYDSTAPNSPGVTSTVFPPPGENGDVWSTVTFGTSGLVEFSPNGTTDIKEYQYSFDTSFSMSALPNPSRANYSYPAITPPHAGPSVLYVRTVDLAGNVSSPTKYLFYVTPKPDADSPGDVTGDGVADVYTIDPDGNLQLWAKSKGTDRLHLPMPAAYTTAQGKSTPLPDGYWSGALITHNGDWAPGDGVQDLLARMPDGKLYVYPGDGYGSFDVTKRQEVLMPAGAPAPSSFRQITSISDVSGDGLPDMMALSGSTLWSFTGYTGSSFTSAAQLSGDDWGPRTIVQVDRIDGDTALDMVYRTDTSGRLYLRKGKLKAGTTGTDPASFATQAASTGGLDVQYGSSGWASTAIPFVIGTPDVSGDGVPDVWAVFSNGNASVYPGSRTAALTSTTVFNVINSSVGTSWTGHSALG
ncbi:DNRLRE domain-containing protein [Streptomyces sp. NPDC093546]|uniref:DNRLRE domain-containing protein n=1 Tax=Streptomyces sp. NPDC093546 TaxID=3366040 RepID=UPI003823E876